MKKFIATILVVLAVVLFGGLTAPAANASEVAKVTTVANVTGVTGVISVAGVAIASPETSISTAVASPTRVNIPTWLYVSCFRSMNGEYWCYRYACTYFEKVALGCRDGWYRVSSTWRA